MKKERHSVIVFFISLLFILTFTESTVMSQHSQTLLQDENGYYWDIVGQRCPAFGHEPLAVTAVQSGNFADPTTWDNSTVPTHNTCLYIPHGITVTASADIFYFAKSIGVAGRLIITSGVMSCETILVEPTGTLTAMDDVVISFYQDSFSPVDVLQFGCGLIVLGTISCTGPDSYHSYRIIDSLSDVVLNEEMIEVLRSNATYIGADTSRRPVRKKDFGLNFDYLIDYADADLSLPVCELQQPTLQIRTAPHSPIPAHILIHSSHNSSVSFTRVVFDGLGRTKNSVRVNTEGNVPGRYALHFHHSAAESSVYNCAVLSTYDKDSKWGIVLHKQKNTIISHNFIYGFTGAGIVVEGEDDIDYSIIDNVVYGIGPARASGNGKVDKFQGEADIGISGDGIWLRTNPSYKDGCVINRNTISGCDGYGLAINGYVPTWDGKRFEPRVGLITDLTVVGQVTGGVWIVWDQGPGSIDKFTKYSTMYGLEVVNPELYGVLQYHSANWIYEQVSLEINDFPEQTFLSDISEDLRYASIGFGWESPSYENGGHIIRSASISGFDVGISIPRNCKTERGFELVQADDIIIKNCSTAFWGATSKREDPYGISVTEGAIEDCKEKFILLYYPLTTIAFGKSDVWNNSPLIFFNDLSVFMKEQAQDFVIPSSPRIPEQFWGLTNSQALDLYQDCIGGRVHQL